MTTRGAAYVAYGGPAGREVAAAIGAFRQYNTYPVTVIGDGAPDIYNVTRLPFASLDGGGRWAKLNLDTLSPYDQTLYMDADTRMLAGVATVGFQILDDGYDLVIAPSTNQDAQFLSHVEDDDRQATLAAVVNPLPLQLQAGVFWFAKTPAMLALFDAWRVEWLKRKQQDQGALLRALEKAPVKIWLLGWDWNSAHGTLVRHLFGRARRG